jgi:cytoskeletal protein CcmA (bactofilin family)
MKGDNGMSGKRKWWPILVAAVALLLLTNLAVPVLAGENRTGAQVTVGPTEVLPDDLYASGDIITIDGTIKGDLIAFGSEIRVNGTIEGQVLGAARSIWINGTVQDDVRVAAYQVEIGDKAHIAHDINVAAFSFAALPGSNVGGDVYAFAYQSQANGTIGGSFRGSSNGLYIGGEVGRDVLVDVAAPDPQFNELGPLLRMSPVPVLGPGLHIADTAVISGALKYVSRGEAIIAPSAKVSQVIRETPTPDAQARQRAREPERGFGWRVLGWIFAQIRYFLTLILIGLLLIVLLPRLIPEAAARLRARPWPSLGWGCVGQIAFLISLPLIFALVVGIGLVLGIVTLGGLQTVFIGAGLLLEGLWGIAFAVVTSYVTKIIVGFLIGALLLEQARTKGTTGGFWPLIIGVILYVIVAAIPILGWLVGWVATWLGLGALWLWLRDRWWPRPAMAVVTAPVGGPSEPSEPGMASYFSPPSAQFTPDETMAAVPDVPEATPEEAPAAPAEESGVIEEAVVAEAPPVLREDVLAPPAPAKEPDVTEEAVLGEEPPILREDLLTPPAEPIPPEPVSLFEEPSLPDETVSLPAEPQTPATAEAPEEVVGSIPGPDEDVNQNQAEQSEPASEERPRPRRRSRPKGEGA